MNLFNNKLSSISKNDNLLSATKSSETILDLNYITNIELQTRLKQKKMIKIYIEDNKYFIEHLQLMHLILLILVQL